MSLRSRITSLATLALGFAYAAVAGAAVPILFNPTGGGASGAISVMTFDWMPGNALAINGNPAGGLDTGTEITLLSHARLGSLTDGNGTIVGPPIGSEFTFVAGFCETAVVDTNGAAAFFFGAAGCQTNFFEIWVQEGTPDANPLTGTGFNNTKRILYGAVTDASGNYAKSAQPGFPPLDGFTVDNYPGILTVVGSGATQISVNVIAADPDYFPNFNPAQVDSLKAFFNTTTVTPYQQTNPSANFVGDDAGADGLSPPPANVPGVASVGTVNGNSSGSNLNFIFQADANQSFEPGIEVPGACRVTYGGNDKNGNIDLKKFGSACMKIKGNLENCYTFGGQVGAPTANPALGGPFGEHTHHQVSGPAGDFVFHAGTHSAPKSSRIEATACKDPGACQPAAANAGFKQIDFEGTGSFRTLSAQAKSYLIANGGPADIAPDNASSKIYWFRVDMDDFGEPGNVGKKKNSQNALAFLNADQNNPLGTADPLLADYGSCQDFADVYQFYICPSATPCEQSQAMYWVRGYLTGGNIQLHKIIK